MRGAAAGMLTAMAVTLAAAPASAEPIEMGNENRVLELGVEYLVPAMKASSGIFTPTVSGTLYFEGGQDLTPYSDPEHTQFCDVTSLNTTRSKCSMEAVAGETIYFFTSFAMNDNVFKLYQDGVHNMPLEIQYMQPEQNIAVDFKNYPDMSVTFNQNVKMEGTDAFITFTNRLTGNEEKVTVRAVTNEMVLRVPLYRPINPYMEQGAIKSGDEFKVIVPGLKSGSGEPYADTDAEGNALFTFLCGSLPVTLQSESIPNPILSYWPAGAPEGILTMVFDAELMDDGKTFVSLGWGNPEGADGEYYYETIPCSIEGNTLKADLTGKLRTPLTMTPLFPDALYPSFSMKVNNVRDSFGVPVASPGQGTIGSYDYTPKYTLLENNMVTADFNPGSGTLFSDVDKVNVYLDGLKAIRFSGFNLKVTEKDGTVTDRVIPLSEVTVIESSDTYAEYEFTLPADIRSGAKSVEITLADLQSIDGYDHDYDVRCVYGGFAVTYSEPLMGESIAMLTENTEIFIQNNLAVKYPALYVEYQIIDTDPENTDPVLKAPALMERKADGSYSALVGEEIKLYQGHAYKILFTAWENEEATQGTVNADLGSDFIIVKGTSPAYRYSSLKLSSIDPAEGTRLADDVTEITLMFDGLVNLGKWSGDAADLRTFINLGEDRVLPFKEVVPVQPVTEDGVVSAGEWHLVLPDDYVASLTAPLAISFTAYDQDGLIVRGNEGKEDQTYFNYSWEVAGQYADVTVEAITQEGTKAVKEFKASFGEGINVSWLMPLDEAEVVDGAGSVIAHVADVVIPESAPDEIITEIYLVLDNELTFDGTYDLVIPEGFFALGTEKNTYISNAVKYTFPVGSGVGVDSIATADDNVTVYNAAGILLLDNADKSALGTLAPGLYIVNGRKVILK